MQLARLVLWAAFACATQMVSDDPESSEGAADALLDAAERRFPFLKPAPADPLDLV